MQGKKLLMRMLRLTVAIPLHRMTYRPMVVGGVTGPSRETPGEKAVREWFEGIVERAERHARAAARWSAPVVTRDDIERMRVQ